jgi:hypothetical protein
MQQKCARKPGRIKQDVQQHGMNGSPVVADKLRFAGTPYKLVEDYAVHCQTFP